MDNKKEIQKKSFRDYYNQLDEEQKVELRKQIMDESGMSYPTFYYKLAKNKFLPLERVMISELCYRNIKDLFPE